VVSRPKRLTQRQVQEARAGKVAQVKPQQRPLQAVYHPGSTAADPIVCGERRPDDEPMLVEATGMVFGIRKGQQRWVVGSHVAGAITVGGFVPVDVPAPLEVAVVSTELQSIDRWPTAYTPCVQCGQRPAEPGETLCEPCQLAQAGETPLERALRQAGT